MKGRLFFLGLLLVFAGSGVQAQSQIVFESSSLNPIVNDSFIQGNYSAVVKLNCEVMEDPPNDCYTSIFFNDEDLPSLLYHGEVTAMALVDINMDGTMECILYIEHMSLWDSIEVFALAKNEKTHKALWYQPIEGFLYAEGYDSDSSCDFRIIYNQAKHKLEIQTSRLTDEGIDCNEHLFPVWKSLNVN